jgi:extradiol dioxygenase family protein
MSRPAFHHAFAVDDLAAARAFYAGLLGCPVGRESAAWIDFDFFGHQITAHLRPRAAGAAAATREVDGDQVPIPHFGVILEPARFAELAARLAAAGTRFRIGPRTRFAGQVGEQSTMFVDDPAGNALEFKAFADPARVFART